MKDFRQAEMTLPQNTGITPAALHLAGGWKMGLQAHPSGGTVSGIQEPDGCPGIQFPVMRDKGIHAGWPSSGGGVTISACV